VFVVVAAFLIFRSPQKRLAAPAAAVPVKSKREQSSASIPALTQQVVQKTDELRPWRSNSVENLQKRFAKRTVASGSNAPVEMSEEQYRQIEESFKVTAPMNGFLEGGDNLKALSEARKLLQNPNREIRLVVVQALSWIGMSAAMELAKLTDDPDDMIRNMAQDAFWKAMDAMQKTDLKRDLLAEALKSKDPDVRIRALDESLLLPDAYSFSAFVSSMNDPDESVAALAREKVAFISGESFETREQAAVWFDANKERLQAAAIESEQSYVSEKGGGDAVQKPKNNFDYLKPGI
jgi:hypothetical protein